MSQDSQPTSKKRGCGPVLGIVLALFCLTLGLVVGAGGLYGYLSMTDDGLQQLRLAEPIETPAQTDPADDAPAEVYALAHPLAQTLDAHEALDEAEVRQQLVDSRELLRECYVDELERSPDTRGEIDVQFTVDGQSGDVVAGITRNNHTGSEHLSNCVVNRLRNDWSFSPPDTSGMPTIRFHVLFLPLEPGQS